ncbi:MAG: hypothetical protein V1789_00515 [PVC group bacterium]
MMLLLILPLSPALADTITLKDGSTLEGRTGARDQETVLVSVLGRRPGRLKSGVGRDIELWWTYISPTGSSRGVRPA